MLKFNNKKWLLVAAVCITVCFVCWVIGTNSYLLPFENEMIDSITIYRSYVEDSWKKHITDQEDINLIVKRMNSMQNLGCYHSVSSPAGGVYTYMIFHLKDGTYFACSFGLDQYFTDGDTRMKVYGTFLEKLWNDLEYPSEQGWVEQDNVIVPKVWDAA